MRMHTHSAMHSSMRMRFSWRACMSHHRTAQAEVLPQVAKPCAPMAPRDAATAHKVNSDCTGKPVTLLDTDTLLQEDHAS